MSPEFGSTAAIFPIDDETLDYLQAHRPQRRAGRAGRGLRQGAGPVARPEPDEPELLRVPRARPVRRSCPRSPGPSARRTASRCPTPRRRSARTCPTTSTTTTDAGDSKRRRGRRGAFPASDPASPNGHADDQRATLAAPPPTAPTAGPASRSRSRRRARRVRARPRRRGDRLDHLVHQHLEPVGDARRRAAGPQRRREGPDRPSRG